MNAVKVFISVIMVILLLPFAAILLLSFQGTDGHFLKWYYMVVNNPVFTEAFKNAMITSLLTAALAVSFSFLIGLSWFHKGQRKIVLVAILLIALLPPDIMSISINKISSLLGFQGSNSAFLILSLIIYCLPFAVLLLWSSFYFIETAMITAAKDMGMRNSNIALKIIIPQSYQLLLNCFVLCFLLAFNEFPRSYYLSGSTNLISQYLYGRLNSGADGSVYAGSSLTVLLAIFSILIIYCINFLRRGRGTIYS